MADQAKYKVDIKGPGHTFSREVDDVLANTIINLVMTGSTGASTAPLNGSILPNPSAGLF